MVTPYGASMRERIEIQKLVLASPEVYQKFSLRGDGNVDWGVVGRLGTPRSAGGRLLSSVGGERQVWRPSSGMKATADRMVRTPVMPSWISRDEGSAYINGGKVPRHSADTGMARAE